MRYSVDKAWIPVDEKMPCQMEIVLMTVRRMEKEYNHSPFISVGYFGYMGWWCAHDGNCKEHQIEVLAWMPVPEPYREENDYNKKVHEEILKVFNEWEDKCKNGSC